MSDLIINVDPGFKVQELFHNVQSLVNDCAKTQDLDHLVHNMIGLKNAHERSGVALAWMWYKLKSVWHLFDIGDTFEDTVSARTGYNVEVIRRYVRVAEMLDSAPDTVAEQLADKGIKALIPIGNAYAGYDLTDQNWNDLAQTDPVDIPGYIRDEIKHSEPRKGSIRIWMDRTGSLWVYAGDEERRFVGSLELDVAKEEPSVKKAIERIINSAGIRTE